MSAGEATVAGLVLAAGRSSRMGTPKPLLRFGDRSALEQIVARLRLAGVGEIRVVVGPEAPAIRSALPELPLVWVEHPERDHGMLSSVLVGAADLAGRAGACLIWPVDIPLVSPATLIALIAAWRRGSASLVYPVVEGRRGHPPLVALDLLSGCPDRDLPGGLRTLLRAHEGRAREIQVTDPAILVDCDTPADYARLRADPACSLEGFRV